MREFKFRVWDLLLKQMFTWEECNEGQQILTDGFNGADAIAMQFTGLKDKNGVDIYEGDILRVTSDITSEVVNVFYFQGNTCFRFGKADTGTAIFPSLMAMTKEVIGNIHQNPELLEVLA